MAFLIPDDLVTLNLTLPQFMEIIEIRRARSRLKKRLARAVDKVNALNVEIVELQAKEDAMLKAAKGESDGD